MGFDHKEAFNNHFLVSEAIFHMVMNDKNNCVILVQVCSEPLKKESLSNVLIEGNKLMVKNPYKLKLIQGLKCDLKQPGQVNTDESGVYS